MNSILGNAADKYHYKPSIKKQSRMKKMIKQFLQNWLGISSLKAKIHNLEGDLMCLLERDPRLNNILKEMEKNEDSKPTS